MTDEPVTKRDSPSIEIDGKSYDTIIGDSDCDHVWEFHMEDRDTGAYEQCPKCRMIIRTDCVLDLPRVEKDADRNIATEHDNEITGDGSGETLPEVDDGDNCNPSYHKPRFNEDESITRCGECGDVVFEDGPAGNLCASCHAAANAPEDEQRATASYNIELHAVDGKDPF